MKDKVEESIKIRMIQVQGQEHSEDKKVEIH